MAEFFDASPYVRAPVINLAGGITLARALIDACPTDPKPSATVIKACKHLEKTVDSARDKLAERNRLLGVYSDEDTRILDNEADRAWGALRQRLVALALLPQDVYPRAKRSADLDVALFSGVFAFLKDDYGIQNASMAAHLKRIDDDKLGPEINDLAGPECLKAIRSVQPRYEAMVSERLRRDKASGTNLNGLTQALQGAIVNYATKVAASVEHDDAEAAEVARIALLPLVNYRESAATRAARGAAGEAEAEEGAEVDTSAEDQPEPEGDAEAEDAQPEPEPEVVAKPAQKAPKPAAKAPAKPAAKAPAKPAAKKKSKKNG